MASRIDVPEPASVALTATWTPGNAPEPCLSWFGGDSSNPTWDEYVAEFIDEVKPALEAIRRCPESSGLIGSDMNDGYFALSDGRSVEFSWRGWGDFRQAMEGKREGYMAYYC